MQRMMKKLVRVGRERNNIEFLIRSISNMKTKQGNLFINKNFTKSIDKINIRNVHNPEVKSQMIRREPNVENEEVMEHKEFEDSNVLFYDAGDKGVITLNRPKSLNVLRTSMCQTMIRVLKEWESSKKLVILKGAGDKAFCCGGDLSTMKDVRPDNVTPATTFFDAAFRLYHLFGTYKVPVVALMNNITMGGGAGLSIHGKYKVVTEKSIFAMPETSIGFFVDAGCSYLLPRLQGELGLFLGLTGYRLKGFDIIHAGIATHYVLAEKLQDLEQELLSSDNTNFDEIFEKYRASSDGLEFGLSRYIDKIDACFSADSVEEIIERLQNDGSEWSKKVIKILDKMSPTSLKITYHALREGKKLNFTDCIIMERKLADSLIYTYSDFYEGSRIFVQNKDQTPNWQPKSLSDVTTADVLKRFAFPSPNLDLKIKDK